MMKKVLRLFDIAGKRHFWGNYFDSRFYISHLIATRDVDSIIEIGCGGGILLNMSSAPIKVGLDFSFESLKDGKKLNPESEFICGDAMHLPLKDKCFSLILGVQILPEIKKIGLDWILALNELKRISKDKSELIVSANNRLSKHFENKSQEERNSYLNYSEQVEILKKNYHLSLEGYDPHSKIVMYPLKKFILNLPEKFIEVIKLEKIIFNLLRSKRYLKNGRSYLIICKKKIGC